MTATARMSAREITTPPMSMTAFCASIRSGMPFCEPPSHRMPTFCRMNDMPTAVISGASLGALRNGR